MTSMILSRYGISYAGLITLLNCMQPLADLTDRFQATDVPLICEVLPAFRKLQLMLDHMSGEGTLHPVCRVAAHCGRLVCDKYYAKFKECDAYLFAIGMYFRFKVSHLY